MQTQKLRIGYVPIIQLNFRGDKQAVYERTQAELSALACELGFELSVYSKLVVTPEEAEAAAETLRNQKTDFVLIQSTSFASGFLIQSLSKAAPNVGLWAVEEESRSGYLPQNSFCGVNLNGSIMKEYMGSSSKYKWFFGQCSDPLFRRRLQVTIRALTALKNARGSTVLHIGGTASGFANFYFDERKLLRRFGVKVADVEYGDLKARAEGLSAADLAPLVQRMAEDSPCLSDLAREKLLPHARVYEAVRTLMEETNASAAAMSCWPRFRADWGFTPCATFGLLNENGYIISCEGDVLSAVSMLLLHHMSGGEPILMDLVSFDRADDTLQLWHCGVGSKTFAKDHQVSLDTHYNPGPFRPETGWASAGPVAVMQFEAMPFTCMRLTRDCDSLLTFTGDIVEKHPVYHGSAGWIGNLNMDQRSLSALELVETILSTGFQHHYPLVKGDFEPACRELAAWLDISPLAPVPYRDYLQMR